MIENEVATETNEHALILCISLTHYLVILINVTVIIIIIK